MNVHEAYQKWSATYDSDPNATRDLDQTVLAKVLGEDRFDSIIEAGCGTGKNTAALARIGQTVTALDFSSGMIELARAKLGQASNVTFQVADITQPWPCAAQSAGLVTCNLILEHIQNLSPVFSEAARVLKPGGQFFVSELHPFRQYGGTVANYRRGEEIVEIPAFVHHLSDFLAAGRAAGFQLNSLREWWHEKDAGKPPRLVTFLFEKTA